jgi:hypothetical protein
MNNTHPLKQKECISRETRASNQARTNLVMPVLEMETETQKNNPSAMYRVAPRITGEKKRKQREMPILTA